MQHGQSYIRSIMVPSNSSSGKVGKLYTQTKVKQHHIFSETLFWKLQNGIYGKWISNIFNFIVNFSTFMSTLG